MLLSFTLLLLSGAPISLAYVIKCGANFSNYTSFKSGTIGSVAMAVYSIRSYLYGMKLVILSVKKHRMYFLNLNDSRNKLLFTAYLSVLIIILLLAAWVVLAPNHSFGYR